MDKQQGPTFRGTTEKNCPSWPGKIVSPCMSYLPMDGLVRNLEPTIYHQLKNLGKVKRGEEALVHMSYQPPRILLTGIYLD